MNLSAKHCIPCQKGTPPLRGEELQSLFKALSSGWQIIQEHHLEKNYTFKNFRDGLAFVNRVGQIAETEGHHPNIALSWGKVTLTLWTHKIDGLTENDFILAAKCDGI